MQTFDYIKTVQWIVSQYSDETKDVLFAGLFRLRSPDPEERKNLTGPILRATSEVALVAERVAKNHHAVEILRVFNLAVLADTQAWPRVAEQLLVALASERGERPDIDEGLRSVWRAWHLLRDTVGPLERLLVPAAVTKETDFDEILTLELRYDSEEIHPRADVVAAVLADAERLYSTFARMQRASDYPHLTVVYADSGSSIRLDFKGLGEPIRELKLFLVELWNRYRHRHADEYRANADALLSGLKAVSGLAALREQGAITDEEFARYKHDLLSAGVGIFESGTLPREIPRFEVVPNQRVLVELQRKLLPPPPEDAEQKENTPPVSPRSRKTSRHKKGRRK